MGKRKVHGATITFNQEHVDEDGYHRCNECDSKTILVCADGDWKVDSEPLKSGETVESDEIVGDGDGCVFVGEVCGHYCPTCEMLVSLSYNFS